MRAFATYSTVNVGKPSRRKLPYSPAVRELIKGKHQTSAPISNVAARKGFTGWHERGYLPHRDAPGLTQFVTFRLNDSFPSELRAEWKALFEIENDRERKQRLEHYLDLGKGSCCLRLAHIAKLVEESLLLFHAERYSLRAWVIMPNHVHVLVEITNTPLAQILEGWKSCTARAANKVLNRTGAFWQSDYWDTFMRDGEHITRSIRYIENNPVKAGLAAYPHDWAWSSARYRSSHGTLQLPVRSAGVPARSNTEKRAGATIATGR